MRIKGDPWSAELRLRHNATDLGPNVRWFQLAATTCMSYCDGIVDLWENYAENTQHETENNKIDKYTDNTQHSFYVETLNGEKTMGTEYSTIQYENTREYQFTTLFRQSVSATHGSWHPSSFRYGTAHTHSLHSKFITTTEKLLLLHLLFYAHAS